MKELILLLTFILPVSILAQDYIKPNEQVLFEFKTETGKRLVLAVDTAEKYIVYRFGRPEKIEFEFPEELKSSWTKFQYSWYFRGGGVLNEGMDLNYLYFDNEDYRYVMFQEYYSPSEKTEYGIKVINLDNTKTTTIPADEKTVNGTLTDLREMENIRNGEELFE